MERQKKNICKWVLSLLLAASMIWGCGQGAQPTGGDDSEFGGEAKTREWQPEERGAAETKNWKPEERIDFDSSSGADSIPPFSGTISIELNGNIPEFTKEELTIHSFEEYSELDFLGRCQAASACIGQDLMPTGERESIGMVKPSGWHTIKYDFVDGKYLYNRCHLIGYQLSGENANEKNLITGTRYFNTEGMLPWENLVASYVNKTGNHVMYRVTPMFKGDNLVADGVRMEALSVEDEGAGVCFDVFVYNVQPGVSIDYRTGDSEESQEDWFSVYGEEETEGSQGGGTEGAGENEGAQEQSKTAYVLNTNTMKFHVPSCSSVDKISDKNREDFFGDRRLLLLGGYEPCGICHP